VLRARANTTAIRPLVILLFTTDDGAVRRIHQVCCRLGDIIMGGREA
jgi:hypothetical protein